MLKTILVLPDGSELSSGVGTADAVASITLTQCVNDSRELSPGSVCANMLEAKLITPRGGLRLAAGDEVGLYREENGLRYNMGLFTLEEPLRPSANTLSITAYDRVSWLDKDLTSWLAALTGWPYRLQDFAAMVCEACGLELENTSIPNGDFPVPAFTAQGITGRQLMQWAAQAAGKFCRATVDGKLEFAWYTPTDITVGPGRRVKAAFSGETLTLSGVGAALDGDNVILSGVSATATGEDVILILTNSDLFYYMGGLNYEDYTVAPIEKVQVKFTDHDVGTVYPDRSENCNTLAVSGNYLLTASMAQALEPVAEELFAQLQDAVYTPCTVTMPATTQINAGDIITVTDPNGKSFTTFVMTKTQAGQRDTLSCTGSPRRDSSTAVNRTDYKALTGKVLELQADIEGIRTENRDAAGNLTRLEMDLEGISTQVSQQQAQAESVTEHILQMEQDAQSLSVQVKQIVASGASRIQTGMGYTFDDDGLHIQKQGDEVSTLIDHTGMQVSRSGENVLQATAAGVKAIDITVKNYLIVGDHARLESYTDGLDSRRTACFFL